jgi:trimeric autotransporter adhesin
MKTMTNIIYPAFGLFAFAYFALSPVAQAVGPDTEGNIPGSNNGEGIGVLVNRTSGLWNTGTGFQALNHLTAGNQNTATGFRALFNDTNGGFNTATGVFSLFGNTSGFFNNADGAYALANNISGINNTATGYAALYRNTASNNTANGSAALFYNSTGANNTANGSFALHRNTIGSENTAYGFQALNSNTIDSFNTAIGVQALFSNTGFGGHNNTATGYQALFSNTTGRRNTADGNLALYSNTTGRLNTAVGDQALYSNTTGSFNTAIGWGALGSYTDVEGANTAVGESALVNHTTFGGNTAVGESALVNNIIGGQNIVMGYAAGQDLTDGSFNIYISNPGVPAENTTIRIGNVVDWTDIYGFPHAAHTATYMAGVSGQTASGGVAVYINSDGKLGTLTSSARFKAEIEPMDNVSEAILGLKPVTFRYKKELDPEGTPQFGLVAEEVEKVNPDLVARDPDGKPYTVRYEAVNAMLLNEFLKAHRQIEDQQHRIAQLKSGMELLTATVKEQASQIQKVSAQLELQKPLAQTVVNNQR